MACWNLSDRHDRASAHGDAGGVRRTKIVCSSASVCGLAAFLVVPRAGVGAVGRAVLARERASRSTAAARTCRTVRRSSSTCRWPSASAIAGRPTCGRGSACRVQSTATAPAPEWSKEIYQAGLRYERPGAVSTRIDLGYNVSPIGLGVFDTRPGVNPTIGTHISYVSPMPAFDLTGPRVSAVSATYPLGAQVSLSTDIGMRAPP